MSNKDKKEKSIWQAIKSSIYHMIESETTSTKGKLNLIFGIVLFLFAFACCIKSGVEIIADKILCCLNSKLASEPNNLIIIFFGILLVLYFIGCMKFVDGDTKLKEDIKK